MAQFKIVFEKEWKISLHGPTAEFADIVIPPFAPFPDNSVTFRFEGLYQTVGETDYDLFKLQLFKLSRAPVSPTLKATVSVNVKYYDGSLYAEYQNLPLNHEIVTFKDVVRKKYQDGFSTLHGNKIKSNTLYLKCIIAYNDENCISYWSSNEMKSCNKYLIRMRNLKSIYEPSILSDIIFKVGDKSFPAHKIILAAHSPVFKNMMMTHEFLESKTSSVTIADAKPEIFEAFLRYFYSGELENKSCDSLYELYYLAEKYDVGFLKTECAESFISMLSVDSVCEILKLAYSYSDSDLKNGAINFAIAHIEDIVPREDWQELLKTHPIIGYEVTVNFIPK